MIPAPKRRWFRLPLWALLVLVAVGLSIIANQWVQEMILAVERDAARDRVLQTRGESDYDRELLGNEVDSLKAEYQRQIPGRED